jgi:hypothetical protein
MIGFIMQVVKVVLLYHALLDFLGCRSQTLLRLILYIHNYLTRLKPNVLQLLPV